MFAPCGFRREAMFPAYGLAEATLVVSGGAAEAAPITRRRSTPTRSSAIASSTADRAAASRRWSAAGTPCSTRPSRIVDPATCQARAAGRDRRDLGQRARRGALATGGAPRKPRRPSAARSLTAMGRTYPAHGRPRIPPRRRALRHRPPEGPDHRSRRQSLPAGHRVDGRAEPPGVPSWLRCGVLDRRRWHGAAGRRGRGRARTPAHRGWRGARARCTQGRRRTARAAPADAGAAQDRHGAAHDERQDSAASVPRDFLADRLVGRVAFAAACRRADAVPQRTSAAAAVRRRSARAARRPAARRLAARLRRRAAELASDGRAPQHRSARAARFRQPRHARACRPRASIGGLGFGHRDAHARSIEQLGAIDQTLAMMTIVHNVLGIGPILHHGDATLKARMAAALATRPGARRLRHHRTRAPAPIRRRIVSTAVPDGTDAWRLHGHKSWSGTAGWASVINVFAQNLDDGGSAARPQRLCRAARHAWAAHRTGSVDAGHARHGAEHGLPRRRPRDARSAPRRDRRRHEGRAGRDDAGPARDRGGLRRRHQAMPAARSCATPIGAPISTGPLDRQSGAAGSRRGVDAPRSRRSKRSSTRVAAASGCAATTCPSMRMSSARLAGSEWLWRAADDLVQFLGGRGYIETNIAAQLLRDARVTRILEGPTEALTMFLGSRVVNDDASALQQFLETLGAGAVARRLASAADTVHARCLAHPRFGGGPEARRWAYALIGADGHRCGAAGGGAARRQPPLRRVGRDALRKRYRTSAGRRRGREAFSWMLPD